MSYEKITPTIESVNSAIKQGYEFIMSFESSDIVIAYDSIEEREAVINELDYTNYNDLDHRYTQIPILEFFLQLESE
jgi:hypothetical protein